MKFHKADLIVARYKEDLSWITSEYDNIFVYNKGEEDINGTFNITKLKNVGRESHTYIYHIVNKYNNLNEINIFSQGSINDHGFSESYLHKLYIEAQIYGYSLNKNFYPEWVEPFGGYKNFKINNHGNKPVSKSRHTLYEWKKHFEISDDEGKFKWYQKAIFAISREYIHTRPLKFYESLLNDPELNELDPEIGHFYERSWAKIFNTE